MARAIIGGIVSSTLVRVPVFSVLMGKLRDSSGRFLKVPEAEVLEPTLVAEPSAIRTDGQGS